MIWKKLLATCVIVLMSVNPAFAFPYDPTPSSIEGSALPTYPASPGSHPTPFPAGGGADGTNPPLWGADDSTGFYGFNGNWANTLRSLNKRNLLVTEYMDQLFKTEGGGPGGAKDLKIWTTPSFSDPVKMKNDEDSWNYLLAHPGNIVPPSVGLSMLTTHDEMIEFIEGFPKDRMTLEYLGEIPRGFPFPMMVFSTKTTDRSPAGLKATGMPLVWIQGNVHGGEWSGAEATLAMAHELAIGTHDALLEKINVVVIPRMNADGAKYPIRGTADTLALQWTAMPERRDLNRDHILLDHPVTRAMKKMLAMYAPHFSVDMHERGNANISSGEGWNSVEGRFGRVIDNDAGDLGTAGSTSQQLPRDFQALRYNELDPVLGRMALDGGVWMGLYREGNCPYAQGNETAFSNNWMNAWGQTYWVPNHPDNVARYNGLVRGIYWSDQAPSNAALRPDLTQPGGPYNGADAPVTRGSSSWQSAALNGLITSTAFDPDAPYFIIQEAQYNPRNARNNNAMAGAISQLYENKSGPTNVGNRGMFERRVAAAYVPMVATMTDAANRADFWIETLEGMRAQWVEKGKTVSEDDMIAILPMVPKPSFWGEPNPEVGYRGHDLPWMVVDITDVPDSANNANPVTQAEIDLVINYDATKAMKYVGPGHPDALPGTKFGAYKWVTDETGTREYQPFKFVYSWQGPALRERVRPYAYIMDGPYAAEGAMRMSLNGIEVQRLAEDMEIEVEAHKYNQAVYVENANSGAGGWRNRDVTFFNKTKLFKKDETYVVYLAQVRTHFITTYFEPDMPYAGLPCMYLPYMSVGFGGAGEGYLAPELVDLEMPTYRYLQEADLPTYPMNNAMPLINRGGVTRTVDFPTQDQVTAIAADIGVEHARVYNWDIQVHTRTDALVGGQFDITLPTNSDTTGYMIRKADGTYVELTPHADQMFGMNVATVTVADVAGAPFTIDIDPVTQRPVVGGAARQTAYALPPNDDLVGIQVVEITDGSGPGGPGAPASDDDDSGWNCN